MRVIVVGIGGVGMAHVCAAVRCGYEVQALVDINGEILDRSKSKWENKWLDFTESVQVQKDTIYLSCVPDLLCQNIRSDDLIILATPPHTHLGLIAFCLNNFSARVLVEKPISIDHVPTSLVDDRLILSTEWLYHSKQFPSSIHSIGMSFPKSSTTIWGYKFPPLLDFCPHLFSILVNTGLTIMGLQKVRVDENSFELQAYTYSKEIAVFGSRESEDGLVVNNKVYDWEEHLFDHQLLAIEGGSKGVKWGAMLRLENLVRGCL